MAARAIGRATGRAVTKKKLIPQRVPLLLTQSAGSKLKDLMKERPEMLGVKICVKTLGCNGLSYTLEYAQDKEKFDEEVTQDGVKVFIDSKAQLTLLGTEMDFIQTQLAAEFVFNNPNIKGTCGCGERFNV